MYTPRGQLTTDIFGWKLSLLSVLMSIFTSMVIITHTDVRNSVESYFSHHVKSPNYIGRRGY